MYMEWSDKYCTGIETFDGHHKRLFNLTNTLLDGLRENKGREAMGKVIDELIDYTDYHFKAEEEAFESSGYPDMEEQKKEHENLISQVKDFKERYEAGTALMTVEMLGFLKRWLENHIANADKKYGPFLSQKGIK